MRVVFPSKAEQANSSFADCSVQLYSLVSVMLAVTWFTSKKFSGWLIANVVNLVHFCCFLLSIHLSAVLGEGLSVVWTMQLGRVIAMSLFNIAMLLETDFISNSFSMKKFVGKLCISPLGTMSTFLHSGQGNSSSDIYFSHNDEDRQGRTYECMEGFLSWWMVKCRWNIHGCRSAALPQ